MGRPKKNGAASESGVAQTASDGSYKVAQLRMTSRKWRNFRRFQKMARFQKVARPQTASDGQPKVAQLRNQKLARSQKMARLQTVPTANKKWRGVG